MTSVLNSSGRSTGKFLPAMASKSPTDVRSTPRGSLSSPGKARHPHDVTKAAPYMGVFHVTVGLDYGGGRRRVHDDDSSMLPQRPRMTLYWQLHRFPANGCARQRGASIAVLLKGRKGSIGTCELARMNVAYDSELRGAVAKESLSRETCASFLVEWYRF